MCSAPVHCNACTLGYAPLTRVPVRAGRYIFPGAKPPRLLGRHPSWVELCEGAHENSENPNTWQWGSEGGCLRAGLAFGAFLGETQHVTDAMLVAAAETLPALIRPTDLSAGRVFPRLADIRRAHPRALTRAARHGALADARHGEALMHLLLCGTWQLGHPRGLPRAGCKAGP